MPARLASHMLVVGASFLCKSDTAVLHTEYSSLEDFDIHRDNTISFSNISCDPLHQSIKVYHV